MIDQMCPRDCGHSLAPVFSGSPGELSKYTFFARLALGSR